MYRSQEIIEIFNEYLIPEYITTYILDIERKVLFKKSLYDWTHFSIEAKLAKIHRFFYEYNNEVFLSEIQTINGNFTTLNKHRLRIRAIKRKNNEDVMYLNSVRY